MKTNIFIRFLSGILILSTSGCGHSPAVSKDRTEGSCEAAAADHTGSLSFSDFRRLRFTFTSGAGAWATTFTINEDGSFSGEYRDSDMGSNTLEYPGGIAYQCTFSGQFSQPEKVDDNTWAMQIEAMEYARESGTEEIRDGIRYIYSDAYGLENADNILIYRPGTPLGELPEGFLSWVGYSTLNSEEDTELPFYALYNENMQYGFMSYDIAENLRDTLSSTESRTARLEDSIENDAALSQDDLNALSADLYAAWDALLNQLWEVLQQILDEDTMETLTLEERAWIAEKEQAVKDAAASYDGGSVTALVCNMKAADMTRERVYELMEYLE